MINDGKTNKPQQKATQEGEPVLIELSQGKKQQRALYSKGQGKRTEETEKTGGNTIDFKVAAVCIVRGRHTWTNRWLEKRALLRGPATDNLILYTIGGPTRIGFRVGRYRREH